MHKHLLPIIMLLLSTCSSFLLSGCTQSVNHFPSETPSHPVETNSPAACCSPTIVVVRETVLVKETVLVTQTVLVLLAPTHDPSTPTPTLTNTTTPTLVKTIDHSPTREEATPIPATAEPESISAETNTYLRLARTSNANLFNLLGTLKNLEANSWSEVVAHAGTGRALLAIIRGDIDSSTPAGGLEAVKSAQLAACDHIDEAITLALRQSMRYAQETDLAYLKCTEAEGILNQFPE